MFRHSFIFARALVLVKPFSKPHLRLFIIEMLNPSKKPSELEEQQVSRSLKDDPSAIFDGVRKSLDKLGKDISNLPDTPGSGNELAVLEKNLELLGKALQEFQKSIDTHGKDTNASQTDDNEAVHHDQALTTHVASFIPDTQSGVVCFDSVVVFRSALFPTTTNHISCIYHPTNFLTSNSPSEDHISSTSCHLPTRSWAIFGVFDGHNDLPPATSSTTTSSMPSLVSLPTFSPNTYP